MKEASDVPVWMSCKDIVPGPGVDEEDPVAQRIHSWRCMVWSFLVKLSRSRGKQRARGRRRGDRQTRKDKILERRSQMGDDASYQIRKVGHTPGCGRLETCGMCVS